MADPGLTESAPPMQQLVPQQGRMCLLDSVAEWSAETVLCRARSHLDPANPLRRDGRLAAVCGAEYGLQAAAAHGSLTDDDPDRAPGYLAAIRGLELLVPWLDDPAFGTLDVQARLLMREGKGFIYGFELTAETGRMLVRGRGTIMIPHR